MSEISFWLDNYDDIFSDFDPRSYHKRRLSEDFLDEIKTALKYHREQVDALVLLLPKEQRKADIEPGIISQIKMQVQLRMEAAAKRERKILRRGISLLLSGVVVMYLDSVLSVRGYTSQIMVMLRIIMEPASWFLMWTGLDSLFYDYRQARPETAFYRAACELKIRFADI